MTIKLFFFLLNFDGLVMNINVPVNYFQGFWCSDTVAVSVALWVLRDD